MRKNDRFSLTIEDLSVDGEGIGHHAGMAFFVNGAVPGDVITAQVTKLKKHYGYARVAEIIAPSADRAEPPCPAAQRCGGCRLQTLSYPKQLAFKASQVHNALIRIGGFESSYVDNVTEPIIGMDEPFRYRNKAQYPIGYDSQGRLVSGFYAARSHRIVPVDDCMLGPRINGRILDIIKSYMTTHGVEAYDEETGRGLLRHVLIREGFHTGEIMVCLVVNGSSLPSAKALISALAAIEGMASIVLNVNTKRTNVILGDKTKVLWGRPFIRDEIGGVKFEISARSFYQVNPVQTEKLYRRALAYADLSGSETVWDLYCGIGTISLFLALRAGRVIGVEVVPEAVSDARRNAAINGLDNVRFLCGKAEEILPAFYGRTEGALQTDAGAQKNTSHMPDERGNQEALSAHPDVIVIDPPRKGCDARCLETMVRVAPPKIVYVSCNPATLARDLKYLHAHGYELAGVTPFDQFPQSVHVECAALMTREQ